MNWNELVIHTTNEAVEPISNLLNEFGANGVVIEDPTDLTRVKRDRYGEIYELDPSKYPEHGVILKAYFIDNIQWDDKFHSITREITQLRELDIDLGLNEIKVNEVEEEDWENEWKKFFKPEKVTNTLVIVPSWEKYDQQDYEKIITIDPGMAFGTGTHPTTKLSLQALEEFIKPNDIVLDVGSGSGILSIGAVLLGAQHVYSYDLDEVAVHSTMANRNLNHFKTKITVKQNDLLKEVSQKGNIIVSNILAEIILHVVDDAWNNLIDGGYFITSGIIAQKANQVAEKMKACGFKIIQRNEQENWISFVVQKVSNE